jgi:hypothetical protein
MPSALRRVGAFLSVAMLGCDQDPLQLACRPVEGPYCLERFEDERYYLRDRRLSYGLGKGGVLGGPALRLTRSPGVILAQRQAIVGGEVAWVLVNVQSDTIIGPLTQADVDARSALPRAAEAVPSAVFWEQLPRTSGSR